MPDNTPKTLTCPSCGAPLEFDGSSALVQCKFCKTTAMMPGFQAQQQGVSAGSLAEIRKLAQGGNMVDAIRRFREMTGLDLKQAKEAVEQLVLGKGMEFRQAVVSPLSAQEVGRVLEQVQELLRSDDKVGAIRIYREGMDVSSLKAREVVDQVEAALKGLPIPTPAIFGEPSSIPPQVQQKRKSMLGILVLSFLLVAVGGVVAVVLFMTGRPFAPTLIANGPADMTFAGDGSSALAAAFYNINEETYLVGMLDAVSGDLRWLADPVPGSDYIDFVAQGNNMVYVASQADLLAYQAGDGSLAWQTVMPDELNYDDHSLLVAGGRLLTNNLDQSIQAYNAVTGSLVWNRRLSGYDRSLRMVGDSLMVFDYADEDYTYEMVFLDPLDGREQRVLTPSCPTSEYSPATIDPDSGYLYDAAENALYLVYDSSPGCIQRLDLASGQPTWSTLDEEWYSFSADGFTGLLTDERLIFSTGNRLLSVEKTTGSLQVLLADADNEILPLVVNGDTLIVRLRRTRGSEHFELRALDISTGEVLWQKDMGDAKPIDPPDEMIGLVDEDGAGWTWHLADSGLVLLQFQAFPNQVVIQTIDPGDGTLIRESIVPLKSVSGDFYSVPGVIAWSGDLVYLAIDAKIYCINLLTGEVLFHYQ